MSLLSYMALPFHAPALLTAAKSFRKNPLIGSPALNARGLHLWRCDTAERMADARRVRLAHLAAPEHREAYARDGFVMVENALPADDFAALSAEVEGRTFPAREMRQGAAVTRFIDLPPAMLAQTPTLRRFVQGQLFRGLLKYVAATDGDPLAYLHTVITNPDQGRPDPQTVFHSDTFHATAKCWLFLRDVDMADGPFVYVPGSHRMTPGRRAWEHARSLTAATDRNGMHANGSFRASAEEMAQMGYGAPVAFPVRANTLVVADTHGFHARGLSLRPSVRVALYGSLRRNPFLPWTGFDPLALPGLRGRSGVLFGQWLDLTARLQGRRSAQPKVGDVAPGDPTPRL